MIDKTAVILAGGKSSRMRYKDKSFLKYGSKTFIEKIIEEVSSYREIIIVANDTEKYEKFGVKVVKDIIVGRGPLSGIHSGLSHAGCRHSLVVACDMPFLSKELLDYLGNIEDDYDVLVPRSGDLLQPLCAIYSKECLDAVERSLNNDIRKIINFFPEVNVKYIEIEYLRKKFGFDIDKILENINTVEEYNANFDEPGRK